MHVFTSTTTPPHTQLPQGVQGTHSDRPTPRRNNNNNNNDNNTQQDDAVSGREQASDAVNADTTTAAPAVTTAPAAPVTEGGVIGTTPTLSTLQAHNQRLAREKYVVASM